MSYFIVWIVLLIISICLIRSKCKSGVLIYGGGFVSSLVLLSMVCLIFPNRHMIQSEGERHNIKPATEQQIAHCRGFLKEKYTCSDFGYSIKSEEFERVYFVAVKVYGPKYKDGVIGVWAVSGSESDPRLTFSVNAPAVNDFSLTGDIRDTKMASPHEYFPEVNSLEKHAKKMLK